MPLRLLGVGHPGFHLIAGKGVTTVLSKVEAISKITVPHSVPTLRTFQGAVGVYSMFIRGFADIAAPLFQLLRSRSTWNWGTEQQIAFDKLRQLWHQLLCWKLPTSILVLN
jgi:hypothetical protein